MSKAISGVGRALTPAELASLRLSRGSRHTAGPWLVHPQRAVIVPAEHIFRPLGGATDAAFDRTTYAQEVCALHWPDRNRDEEEVRANAALISSAPDLLTALVAMLPIALEALQFEQMSGDGSYEDLIRAVELAQAAISKAAAVSA